MSELLKNLNEQQQQAVTHGDGPLLIVAGAGTGKTTVIANRIAYLITEKNLTTDQVLALTFTEKAAGEMDDRVSRLLPYGYVDLWVSTFHSFAERILQAHGLEIGLPQGFKLLTETEQWMLVRQNLDKFNLKYYKPLGNPTKFIHALIKHFSRAKDECVTPETYLQYVEDLKLNNDNPDFVSSLIDKDDAKKLSKTELKELLAEEIVKQAEVADSYFIYQKLLVENNALDFGDLINYCLKLFQTRKNLLAKYRQQFKYIMVDEFQDTNFAQYELIKLLAAPTNNVTVVGDDDQSIYKFRGASISNILQFKDDHKESKEIFLTQNYRNTQDILDLSYGFIKQNDPYRLEVRLAEHQSDGKKFSKKLSANISEQGIIEHLHAKSLDEEIILVINKIIELYNKEKETAWSDFAILVRANAAAEEFAYALETAKVPYEVVASRGLYGKRIVMDLISYLKLLDDYHESPAMYRTLVMPIFNISEADIINLNHSAHKKAQSLYETISSAAALPQISPEGKNKLAAIVSLIARHSALAKDKKTSEVIQDFLQSSGYLKYLTENETVQKREQLSYLNQFYKKICDFEKTNPDQSIKSFLDLLELELEAGEEGALSANREDASPDCVKIMTIHSAKGLEFKYVFIANLVDQRFPTRAKGEPLELPAKLVKEITPEGDFHLQEERRLMYVAMTRAKQGLFFTSATDYGGARAKKLSQFLIELGGVGLELAPEALDAKNIKKESPTSKHPTQTKKEPADSEKKFSFTQLRAFENCPYQYRYSMVLRIPVKGKPSLSFGKTMHLTLQRLLQQVLTARGNIQSDLLGENKPAAGPDFEQLKKIYEEAFIRDWYPDKATLQKYYDGGLKSLKIFFDNFQKEQPQVKFLEYPFSLKITPEIWLKGSIDRVDETPEGLRLIDYKTGAGKAELKSDDKEQLLIYQLAAQTLLRQPVKELVFDYLEEGREVAFLGKEKEIEKIKEKIIKVVDEIKQGDFSPKPGELCKFCDFNYICEYRK